MPAFFALAVGAFSGLRGGAQDCGADFSGKGKNLRKFFPRVRQAGTKIFSAERGIGFCGAPLRYEYFFVFNVNIKREVCH